ncbi:TrkH-domain-containing protein [Thelephora ganbajun]|uniref:TrkH-domain-containing protein n=1 Tax=Thelephora ganbajun TaxID=370292 RepID=A0ACB6ZNT3_THEGA|nr:TrkH-domain-containing protein [Thelephora ganbajun]
MPSLDTPIFPNRKGLGGFLGGIYHHLNFFRIHLLVFTFVPLVFSAILYTSNGENYVSYIDALFVCVSAATVTGLTSIDLSALTTWQQFILFIQMFLGSPIVVSWVMVLIRRYFLAKELRSRLTARDERIEERRKAIAKSNTHTHRRWWKTPISSLLHRTTTLHDESGDETDSSPSSKENHKNRRVRPDMIRRLDDKPKLINPSGWISKGRMPAAQEGPAESGSTRPRSSIREQEPTHSASVQLPGSVRPQPPPQQHNNSESHPVSPPPNHIPSYLSQPRSPSVTRTQTIEFTPFPQPRGRYQAKLSVDPSTKRQPSVAESRIQPSVTNGEGHMGVASRPSRMPRSESTTARITTNYTHRSSVPAMRRGLGGFPMPHEIISSIIHKFFPNLQRRIKRTVTIPVARTLTSQYVEGGQQFPGSQSVAYITFNALVGRNSTFHDLTHEQIGELCGIEFKALNCLIWIIPCYYLIIQATAFIVIAPYMSLPKWKRDFLPPNLYSDLSPVWFSLFQVVSAYTNTGFSLVDQSMIPFQRAYPMVVALIFLIIAGNTGFNIVHPVTRWSLLKLAPAHFGLKEPLTFLLDHPRRCFVYLFPSHQTWFLLSVILGLVLTDWFFFLILDIGTSAIEEIPLTLRALLGLMQAAAVRAAGFAAIPLAALAPGVKVLYVLMMYVSVYPIAMSVRSTNVYEENSLGIFGDEDGPVDENFSPVGSAATVWSRYLALHMRKQLSFDMWWLVLALFLLCIIERPGLIDPANRGWFNIFTIIFELVSAYGTVGLSLGIPTANYSLSGVFHPLSKLIVCLVMLRGRHRGLPVAIDRAVMLPEFQLDDQMSLQRRMSLSMNPTSPHGGDDTSLRRAPTIQALSAQEGV